MGVSDVIAATAGGEARGHFDDINAAPTMRQCSVAAMQRLTTFVSIVRFPLTSSATTPAPTVSALDESDVRIPTDMPSLERKTPIIDALFSACHDPSIQDHNRAVQLRWDAEWPLAGVESAPTFPCAPREENTCAISTSPRA
jgi:hypothetical protein